MVPDDLWVIPTSDCHDCGGRCLLKVHVRDDHIWRISTDDGAEPQYRACAKGRAFRQMVDAPERVNFPLKRIGPRGKGRFERVSWDEALDTVAAKIRLVRETSGSRDIVFVSGSGYGGKINGFGQPLENLLNITGGCTVKWGSPSAEGSRFASLATYGTLETAHTRDDLLNSAVIVMWGWNPAVSLHGTNTRLYLARAKARGAKIIAVDPYYSDSAAAFADEWIPIRPGTDTALLVSLAYIMVQENLLNQDFLDRYTVGYERFEAYVSGDADGVPKTPEWASCITGVEVPAIRRLARLMATLRPSALMPGFGPGRSARGEQFHRACITLAAMTGNIGISGGNAAGHGLVFGPRLAIAGNPLEEAATNIFTGIDSKEKSRFRIQTTQLWDAILEGRAGGFASDCRLLYIVGSNCLNQLLNTNKGLKALAKTEFIVVHEPYLSATARFADILLPVTSHLENEDLAKPLYPESYYVHLNPAVSRREESMTDFDIARHLGERLGVHNFDGKSASECIEELVNSRDVATELPDYTLLKRDGISKSYESAPRVAFTQQIADILENPFPTLSGKIEIYSEQIARLNLADLPPVPEYLPTWEGQEDPLARRYPLQLITPHSKRRANSVFDRVPWLRELEPQALTINPRDARQRDISDGDMIDVFNGRGRTRVPARISSRIMPGVVSLEQGAWYYVDEDGGERGGCANVLTRDLPSPGGAFPSNTVLVEVERTDTEG